LDSEKGSPAVVPLLLGVDYPEGKDFVLWLMAFIADLTMCAKRSTEDSRFMVKAIYPGTFDPITHGHSDLVARAGKIFDQIVVAIAVNRGKEPVFSVQERVALAQEVLAGQANVVIRPFDCLLADLCRQEQAQVILRGLRAVSDFEYEFQLAGMNRRLIPEVETLFLTPAEQFSYISSSLIKEISALGGEVSEFVHPLVEAALIEKNGRRCAG
jgi:pantetheine-phosphate adenylyltransferase